jgi:CheY-like chemotaxis protein
VVKQVLWSESIRSRVDGGKPHFLARASLKALSAGKASVLLDVAATDRPDLIVLSHDLHDTPAVDLCRLLRADDRTRTIPILTLAGDPGMAAALREAGCTEVLDASISPEELQEAIAAMLGMRLRKYARYPVVLPVARGRFIREFLGYSNVVSEGGMGFDTLSRIRSGEQLALLIYRNTEEKPISVVGRVASVRANIDTGIGYAVGIEFLKMAKADRGRLAELFPQDPSVVWGPDPDGGPHPNRMPRGPEAPEA